MDTGSPEFARLAEKLHASTEAFWNEAIEEAAKKAEEYLKNQYQPANAVPLFVRGVRETVQKIADAIRTLKKEPRFSEKR